ncbi:MAG: cell division protein ZapA [Luteitalea sp.]|nr:cell division protein ZapA [Luteitalea sp.]
MSEPSEFTSRIVSVEIQGLRYPVKSDLSADYVARLAAYVDGKMQDAANQVPIGESTKLAVVAALNIADEFFRSRDEDRDDASELVRRAEHLEQLIDEALKE